MTAVSRARTAALAALAGHWDGAARPGAAGEAWAAANVALVKYWGKRDEELKLPVAGSLSVSLGRLGTRTRVRVLDADAAADEVWLDGAQVPPDAPFARRVGAFLDWMRAGGERYEVRTSNTVPTAAGLASSASGFAALAKALDAARGWNAGTAALSILARLGSGSAARSVEEGFVEWRRGERPDGADSFGVRLDASWPELRVGAVVVRRAVKDVGSGEGMRRTAATCPFYPAWPSVVEHDLREARAAVASRDLERLGRTAEQNALSMHALMAASWPPLVYATGETLDTLRAVWAARRDGLPLWLTMDAGPNVKLLFESRDEPRVRERFPSLETVTPFLP